MSLNQVELYQKNINDILKSEHPRQDKLYKLREYAIKLNKIHKLNKDDIYNLFSSLHSIFLNIPDKISEQYLIEDILDMIKGYYSGQNIDF